MRSFKDRRKRDKGVSPYDAGPEDKEGEDKKKQKQKQEDEDFRHVMKKVAAAIAKGEDGGGVAGVEQWSVGALKRWLTRSGVMHNDSYERSELVGRVLQRWLGMTSAEKQSASEAARREMNNEGGAWWRESKEKFESRFATWAYSWCASARSHRCAHAAAPALTASVTAHRARAGG